MKLISRGIQLAENGTLPDSLVRLGIRRIIRSRSEALKQLDVETLQEDHSRFIAACDQSPLALAPKESNQQHYEVPTDFFKLVLGKHLKYSCSYWDDSTLILDDAEAKALAIYCERAELENGMTILELGCGWGSLSLWLAEHYPASSITCLSHSATQKTYIDEQAKQRGITNLEVITSDINHFAIHRTFDRVISIEMFEHVRNHRELFRRISTWLNPQGKLFCHIFCHRDQASPYESHGPQDWMSDYFFTGGMMPSDRLFLYYQDHLRLLKHWRWNGIHYEKTSNAWLKRLDQNRSSVIPLLENTYGTKEASPWLRRWRIFFMACAECFGYSHGNEWFVSHYLFENRK
ncbi:MAG TPA: cyclopropane-fatty-acyl-phospholipid synthase family protein [Gemmatales bacterium]|nr:cyclopropane-fatty-acyl-phospholipid synthase family protein [Gemmatales bacterium]HMP15621.1 cyclopropane-fatty-acyl-phospholipid synthase family protein [Gemmatales bacterium]